MLKSTFLKVLVIGGISVAGCFAQAQPRSNERRPNQPANIIEDLGKLSAAARNAEYKPRQAVSIKKAISRKQKKMLLPNESDSARYADFLREPNTGLIKLFSDVGCEKNDNVIRVNEECLNWIPMSGFYSFREEEYTRNFLSDIRIRDDMLITGGLLAQGILVALGDIELEKATLNTEGMSFLNNYNPESKSSKVLEQTLKLAKGIKSNDYLYRQSLPALENVTYGLRVIAYRGAFTGVFYGQKINILDGDERTDVTIVFRVLNKDEEGTLTLLWKRLSRKDAPKIVFPKPNKNKTNS